MKHSFKALLLLVALFGLFSKCSCRKEDVNASGSTFVSGKVIDHISNKGVAGATVILGSKPQEQVGALGYKTDASTTSDANGNYHFDYNYDASRDYAIHVDANNYQMLADPVGGPRQKC